MTKFSKSLGVAALAVSLVLPAAAMAKTSSSAFSASLGAAISAKSHKVTKNGTVSAVSGNTITFTAKNGTSYTADVSGAKLVSKYGSVLQLGEIKVGDKIQVRGAVTGTAIAATSVRDMSLLSRKDSFTGKVTAVSGSGFTVQTGRETQSVSTASSTVFTKNGQADPSGMADVTVGSTVRVSGLWDKSGHTMAASKINIIVRTVGINFTGILSALTGNSLTVNASSTVYTVDAAKARIQYENGHKADVSILKTGDQVRVLGKHLEGSANISAAVVKDLSKTYVKASSTVSSEHE